MDKRESKIKRILSTAAGIILIGLAFVLGLISAGMGFVLGAAVLIALIAAAFLIPRRRRAATQDKA